MTTKRTLILGIVLLLLLTVGLSAAYAQGPRNGQRGNGTALQSYGQQGSGQQIRLQDPAAYAAAAQAGTATGTAQSYGQQSGAQQGLAQQSSGQGRMGRSQGQNMSGMFGQDQYSTMTPFTGELSTEVVKALEAGWADEQHAYAVYQAVIDQFGAVAPFTAIQRAEASHGAALERAFDYYGLALPTAPATENLTFDSLAEACAVAAEAEIANMGLYDSWLATVSDYPDLVQVFTSLRNASQFNHLPAFENCAG